MAFSLKFMSFAPPLLVLPPPPHPTLTQVPTPLLGLGPIDNCKFCLENFLLEKNNSKLDFYKALMSFLLDLTLWFWHISPRITPILLHKVAIVSIGKKHHRCTYFNFHLCHPCKRKLFCYTSLFCHVHSSKYLIWKMLQLGCPFALGIRRVRVLWYFGLKFGKVEQKMNS